MKLCRVDVLYQVCRKIIISPNITRKTRKKKCGVKIPLFLIKQNFQTIVTFATIGGMKYTKIISGGMFFVEQLDQTIFKEISLSSQTLLKEILRWTGYSPSEKASYMECVSMSWRRNISFPLLNLFVTILNQFNLQLFYAKGSLRTNIMLAIND